MTKTIAIFDIGKTNKKFFLFNHAFQVIVQESKKLTELKDEDGYPCEDLQALIAWIQETFRKYNDSSDYHITHLNFSTYGASLVHLGENNKPILPFYNYLKPVDPEYKELFNENCNSTIINTETASPDLDMLNSGFQLFWLKHHQPDTFKSIKTSLHFPQYLSFLFHGQICSEYTSIGCHTRMWDYEKNNYNDWLQKEGIQHVLPPPKTTDHTFLIKEKEDEVQVGIGIHDSSAALIPYLKKSKEPFILLSTGTWNIALNPFTKNTLTQKDLAADCLFFMDPKGQPVKASRLMLGAEHEKQVSRLSERFELDTNHYWTLSFDRVTYNKVTKQVGSKLMRPLMVQNDPILSRYEFLDDNPFESFEDAYHFLIHSLIMLQLDSLRLVLPKDDEVFRLYVDGGFVNNQLFIQTLQHHLPEMEIIESENPIGSALGAAMVMFN